jgi:formate dehydrogenase maturation protein FdhE
MSNDTPWNQLYADDGYCPYCGTINWERVDDFDWEHSRQSCACELCGAEWWEVLIAAPKNV